MPPNSLLAQKAPVIPHALDSLEQFLVTMPVDTSYALAMKDCAFEYIIRGRYKEADSLRIELERLYAGKFKTVKISYYIPFLKATLAYHQNAPHECLKQFQMALKVVDNNRSKFKPTIIEAALANVAAGFSRINKPDSVMRYSLRAIEVQEQYNITNANSHMKIADLLTDYGKYAQALPYYEKALSINTDKNYLVGLAIVENKLGTLYDLMKKNERAIEYYEKGLRHAEEADYALLQTDLLVNLGLMAVKTKRYAEAKRYFARGEKLCRTLESNGALRVNLHNQAQMYHELGDFTLAKKYYMEALVLARKEADYDGLYTAHQALAEFYIDNKKFEEACEYLRAAAVAKDSIFQIETADKIQEMLVAYESDKKEQQIELLNQQNLVQSLQLTVKRRNEILLIFSLAVVIAVMVFVYRRYRLRNQLAVEKIRSNIAADFHDELGANLSSIALYSDILLQNHVREVQAHHPLLKNINVNARQTLSSIGDLIWAIKPDNDMLEGTLIRMKEFSIPLLEAKNITFEFKIEETLRLIQLDMTARKILYLVFKEAINNAIKYSEATHVIVSLKRADHIIVLAIEDNGKGFDMSNQTRGNGLGNMKKRAAEMKGQLTIETEPGQGCRVQLTFKYN